MGALALALVLGVVGAPQAQADEDGPPSSWRITKYHVDVKIAKDGTATVVTDLDFDFANDRGHGPYIVLVKRMRVPKDPDKWRMIDMDVKSVTSDTGAPTYWVDKGNSDAMMLRIGDPNRYVRGVQNYKITYTVRGLIAPKHEQSGMDEFNWSVIGTGWEVPINNVQVTVTGPTATSKVACFQGRSYSLACSADGQGSTTATYTTTSLRPGNGMQVVAGYPSGTFVGAEPRFTKRVHIGNTFPLEPADLGGAALVALIGGGLVARSASRAGRDRAYLGLAPGTVPARNQEATVGLAPKVPVTVQFHPPKGATPGEIGTLVDASADNRDITATMLDLAVRKHMVIHPDGRGGHTFERLENPSDALRPYEERLLWNMFQGDTHVTDAEMSHKSHADTLPEARSGLMKRVTRELKWFRTDPMSARVLGFTLGILLLAGGAAVTAVMAFLGHGIIGLGALVPGLVMLAMAGKMPSRTPEGSAALAQAKGFELYLTTAEAEQIKFEEGEDVFSKYLPYAVVFGVTERWVKIFERLAAEGRYVGDTSWYGGTNFYYFGNYGFANTVNSLTQSMSQSMNSAVASANASAAGSSGGSGFSGGGGFGGGGGGGW